MGSFLDSAIRACERWDSLTRGGLLVLLLAGGMVLGVAPFLLAGWWAGAILACVPPALALRRVLRERPKAADDDDLRLELPAPLLAGPQWSLFLYASLGLATLAAAAAVPLVWWQGLSPAADDLIWRATLWGAAAAGLAGIGWAAVFFGQAMFHRTLHLALCELGARLEEDPGNLDLWYDRGWLWQATGRLDRAIADFSELIWLDSESPENYYHRGVVRLEAGDYATAVEDFTAALELDPEEPSRFIDRAEALLEAGQSEEAVADFTRAIELDPENPDAYEGRAEALDQLGERKQAGRDWVKAERLRRRVGPSADRGPLGDGD